jgi:hypothetical protein
MKGPLVLQIAGACVAVPVVVGVISWRRVRAARAWVFGWAVAQAIGTALQAWLSAHGTPNLWVSDVTEPVAGALLLWALSLWQRDPVARLTLRLAIPGALAAFVLLTLAFDRGSGFGRAGLPMFSLVCLGAVTYTLVDRSRVAAGDLLRADWLWIGVGTALYYATGSMIYPLSDLLLGGDLSLFVRVYTLANIVAAAAFLAVARGLACPAAA